MRRSDKISFAVLGIGICAVLGSIAIIGQKSAPPDTLADLCPAEATGEPNSVDLEADPAPYQGPGPHPVLLHPNPDGVPAKWRSADESSIQLVACVYSKVTDQRVKTCDYNTVDYNTVGQRWLMRTEYTTTVYEAKTSKKIGQFRTADDGKCPYTIMERYTPGEETPDSGTVAASADNDALVAALRPYVERKMPH